jgi:hypothetical protein
MAACCSTITLHAAGALTTPTPITVDGGPLGSLTLSGDVDGYAYYLTGTGTAASPGLLGTSKNNGADVLTADVKLAKTSGLVQFAVEFRPANSIELGAKPATPYMQSFPLGPFYDAYVSLVPNANWSFSIGQLNSLEGYEATVDTLNANVLESALYYVENSSARGISVTYTQGPFYANVQYGDGWDTNVYNFVQALSSYTISPTNTLSVYAASNLSHTGGNAKVLGFNGCPYGSCTVAQYGSNYVNSTMVGAYDAATLGNLYLVPEVQYVYAKPDAKAGVPAFTSNFGALLLADYSFGTSPYSLGAFAEYFSSNGSGYWFLNPGAKGYGISVTPTWQATHVFVRADAGFLHLTSVGEGGGFSADGSNRNQVTALVETGLMF